MSDKLNKPTGGFPPIYRCSKKDIFEKKDTKNREFTGVINAISIKDIMNKKRENVPFL
jgi:hypothetical protein